MYNDINCNILQAIEEERVEVYGKMLKFIMGAIGIIIAIVGVIIGGVILLSIAAIIGAVVFVFWALYKVFTGGKKRYREKAKLSRVLSKRQIEEANRALGDYFKTADRLIIKGDIYLKPQNGKFTDVDALVLHYGTEGISTLEDLGTIDAEDYKRVYAVISELGIDGGAPSAQRTAPAQSSEPAAASKTRAQDFIENLRGVNHHIPNPEITEGLERTVSLLEPVHTYEKRMGTSDKLDKLYEYYLPILLSILDKYKALQDTNASASEFLESEKRLQKTIELINEALVTINTRLYEGEYLDISTDISTLQAILKKDGVVQEGRLQMPDRTAAGGETSTSPRVQSVQTHAEEEVDSGALREEVRSEISRG